MLLGSKNHIAKISGCSWPLKVLHHLEAADRDTSVSELVTSLIPDLKLSGVGSLLCGLLTGNYIHQMYQSLFDYCCPFLTHLTALLFHSCHQGTAILSLLHEEYVPEMVRNLLYEASQVSYQTLILTYSALQTLDTC